MLVFRPRWMSSSSGVASRCSTMRSTRPSLARIDAAVAGRVVEHAGEQRRRVAVGDVRGDQLVERLGPQQRRVAGQHDDDRIVVVVVTGERAHPDRGGVAGAALLGLLDEGDVGPGRRQSPGTFLVTCSAPWPTTTTVRAGCSCSSAWMTCTTIGRPQMRCSGLGRLGPHARALAGGEDDRGDCHADLFPELSRT